MEREGFCCLSLAPKKKTLSCNKKLWQWASTTNCKTRSSSPFVDRPNTNTAFSTTTMTFDQVAPPAPILTSANTVRENTPKNLVPDQKITNSNPINIMHPPDSQLRISTPIKVKPLAHFLKGYDEDFGSFLTTCYGFKIPY